MSTTFKSWVIANYETIVALGIIVFFEIFVFVTNVDWRTSKVGIGVVGGGCILFFYGLISGIASYSLLQDVFYFVVLLIGYIFLYSVIVSMSVPIFGWLFGGSIIVSFIISIWAVRFTYNHFEEIVSRRIRYINSNVSLFEEKWKYMLNRAISVFNCSSLFFVFFLIECYLAIYGIPVYK